jgi:hypothetical protein
LVGVNTFVRRVNEQGLPLEGLNYSLRSSLALRWVNQQGVTKVSAVARSAAADAPAPQARPSVPAPQAEAPRQSAPPAPAPQSAPSAAREFTTPDGTKMYGVPNMENDLHEALQEARKAYAEVLKRSDDSVREMEDAFDDYDNF